MPTVSYSAIEFVCVLKISPLSFFGFGLHSSHQFSGQSGPQTPMERGHVGANDPKQSRLLDSSSDFVLTYEDKEGDWMLVGDVPWR
jgi:hypothetical protein